VRQKKCLHILTESEAINLYVKRKRKRWANKNWEYGIS